MHRKAGTLPLPPAPQRGLSSLLTPALAVARSLPLIPSSRSGSFTSPSFLLIPDPSLSYSYCLAQAHTGFVSLSFSLALCCSLFLRTGVVTSPRKSPFPVPARTLSMLEFEAPFAGHHAPSHNAIHPYGVATLPWHAAPPQPNPSPALFSDPSTGFPPAPPGVGHPFPLPPPLLWRLSSGQGGRGLPSAPPLMMPCSHMDRWQRVRGKKVFTPFPGSNTLLVP